MEHWLRHQFTRHSSKLLFPLLGGGLHYESMLHQIDDYSWYYKSIKKVVKNQRVIVSDGNRPQLLSKIGALWQLGATPCLLSPSLKPSTKEYCESLLQTFPFPASVHPKEALILFTSGTSSLNPKGVVLSHSNLLSQLDMLENEIPSSLLNETSRTVALLPWTHCYGLIGECFMTIQRGGQMHPISNYHPLRYWTAIQRMSPTVLFTVPAVLQSLQSMHEQKLTTYFPHIPYIPRERMTKRILLGSNIQYIVSGGASLPSCLKDYFYEKLNVPILEGYGCTEMSPMIALQTKFCPKKNNDVGTLLPDVEYKISPDDNELWVRGPNRFLYYLSEKGEHDASPYSDHDKEKEKEKDKEIYPFLWYATGDLAKVVDRKLYLLGRKSLQIKTPNGRFLRLEDIENYVNEYHSRSLSNIKNIKNIKKVGAWQDPKTGKIGVTVFVTLSGNKLPPLHLVYENLNLTVYYASPSMLTVESGMLTQKGELCRPVMVEKFAGNL